MYLCSVHKTAFEFPGDLYCDKLDIEEVIYLLHYWSNNPFVHFLLLNILLVKRILSLSVH